MRDLLVVYSPDSDTPSVLEPTGAAGAALVLSPACSTYDMFRNFDQRGHVFRDVVAAAGAVRR